MDGEQKEIQRICHCQVLCECNSQSQFWWPHNQGTSI